MLDLNIIFKKKNNIKQTFILVCNSGLWAFFALYSSSIHLFSITAYPAVLMVTGGLEPIPAITGRRRGTPSPKSPVYHRADKVNKRSHRATIWSCRVECMLWSRVARF